LARAGYIIVKDPAKSKVLVDSHYERKKKYNNNRKKGPAANTADAETPAPEPAPPAADPAPAPSGRRATSADRGQLKDDNSFAGLYDKEMDSDSDDDMGLDASAAYASDNHPSNNDSTTGYTVVASARRATVGSSFSNSPSSFSPPSSSCNHISSAISSLVQEHLHKHSSSIAMLTDDAECCADTGATDHMLPDHSAFYSYHPCTGRYVTLGDDTRLKIYGTGTAIIALNGKNILIRNALHVPALRAPLYSLRRHRLMEGCGFYAHYNDGNFVLFPTFSLKVDDSKDNLISYRPIGRSYITHLDYAEKRHTPSSSARPAHAPPTIIPDDSYVAAPTSSSSPLPNDADIPSIPLSAKQLHKLHSDPAKLPPIPPSATPSASESRTTFDPLKLHRIFGCRRFKNPHL
jgi:hypothetical protein